MMPRPNSLEFENTSIFEKNFVLLKFEFRGTNHRLLL